MDCDFESRESTFDGMGECDESPQQLNIDDILPKEAPANLPEFDEFSPDSVGAYEEAPEQSLEKSEKPSENQDSITTTQNVDLFGDTDEAASTADSKAEASEHAEDSCDLDNDGYANIGEENVDDSIENKIASPLGDEVEMKLCLPDDISDDQTKEREEKEEALKDAEPEERSSESEPNLDMPLRDDLSPATVVVSAEAEVILSTPVLENEKNSVEDTETLQLEIFEEPNNEGDVNIQEIKPPSPLSTESEYQDIKLQSTPSRETHSITSTHNSASKLALSSQDEAKSTTKDTLLNFPSMVEDQKTEDHMDEVFPDEKEEIPENEPNVADTHDKSMETESKDMKEDPLQVILQRLTLIEGAIFVQQENDDMRFRTLQKLVTDQRKVIEELTKKITSMSAVNQYAPMSSQESTIGKTPQGRKKRVENTPDTVKKESISVEEPSSQGALQESASAKTIQNRKRPAEATKESEKPPMTVIEAAEPLKESLEKKALLMTPKKVRPPGEPSESVTRKHTPFKQTGKMKNLEMMNPDEPIVLFFHGKNDDNRSYAKRVEKLNGKVNNDIYTAHTHLVHLSKETGRYLKTLIALASDIPIIRREWIEQSYQYRSWVDPKQFQCKDIPNHTMKRQSLLPEFKGASVGVYGKLKLPFDEMKAIIAALGADTQQIEMTIRRKKKGMHILIIPEDLTIADVKDEVSEMPYLRAVMRDADLINVIWEGSREFFRNLMPSSAPSHTPSPPQKRRHRGISVPYLSECVPSKDKSREPKNIYPNVLSLEDVAHPDRVSPLLVGRSDSKSDYVLPYEGVSRVHFALTAVSEDGNIALCIEDKKSTNGIFVNGYKRESKTVLHENDVVLVGGGSGMKEGDYVDDGIDVECSAKFIVRIENRS